MQFAEALFGLLQSASPFELERLGDHRNRQRTQFSGQRGDDRRTAGAGAATEAGRNKDHVGAFQHLDNLIGVFERRLPADLRISPRAQPFG